MAEQGQVQVEVLGLAELAEGSADLAKRIGENAGPGMQSAADRAAERVRGSVPVDSGALMGSVTTGTDGDTSYLGMGEGLEYAGWIEFGGTRGRPYVDQGRYVYPAAQAVTPQAVDAASKTASKEIGGYPWKAPSSRT